MYILQIEHPVVNYEKWKNSFDSDPLKREKSGVQRYRICRPITDDNFVIVELELNTLAEAEALLGNLRVLWGKVTGEIIMNPQVQIIEVLESKELKMSVPGDMF